MNDETAEAMDPRVAAIPDIHGHAKGEHKPYAEERPIPYSARMLFLWFFHAARRGWPRFLMVADHINYLTFEDPAAVNLVRRALKLAAASDLYGAAETAGVELGHAAIVSEGLRKGMRYSIGAEVDNDPRSRPDAQNIVDAMKPDGLVRSIHFLTIDHPVHGAGWHWPFDNAAFKELYDHVGTERTWQLYMDALLDAIEKLPGHIVGHFYVPAKFGHWPADDVLERYEDQLVAACAARGMAIELNSRYFYRYFEGGDDPQADADNRRRYRAVNLRLLRKAKAAGVLIAVGSDAHSPKDQGGGFDDVLSLLDEAEINEIAFPINGRLARVALRATEEHLAQTRLPVTPPVGSSVSGFSRAELTGSSRNGGQGGDDAEEAEPAPTPARRSARKTAKKPAAKTAATAANAAPSATDTAPSERTGVSPAPSATVASPPPDSRPIERARKDRRRTESAKRTTATPAEKPAAAARPAAAKPAGKPAAPAPAAAKPAAAKLDPPKRAPGAAKPAAPAAKAHAPEVKAGASTARKSASGARSTAKKPAAAKKATSAKAPARKAKAPAKPVARKATARAPAKPVRAKKSPKPSTARAAKAEKRPSKRRAPAKKTALKKTAARKAPARKKTAKTRR